MGNTVLLEPTMALFAFPAGHITATPFQPLLETHIPTHTQTPTITPTPTLSPAEWGKAPVVPEGISEVVRRVYQLGQDLGRNPHAFSKVGDCLSATYNFLGVFDSNPLAYRLGEDYAYLQSAIGHFQGSFSRRSITQVDSYTITGPLSPLWVWSSQCLPNETPLACEFRLHNPALVIIALGTMDNYHASIFPARLREIIEYTLSQGIVPILATKADNREGGHSINRAIFTLAQEYQLPLWNFWRAVQGLPNGGLASDYTHLTWGKNTFDDPYAMRGALPVRNLTALQTLDAVWRGLNGLPEGGAP
jgi:hypothetical protein